MGTQGFIVLEKKNFGKNRDSTGNKKEVSKHYKMILYLWNKNENQKKKSENLLGPISE